MATFPGFTAETATTTSGRGYRVRCTALAQAPVSPQWRGSVRAVTEVTCEPGTSSLCEDYCQHAGGGMSSNPDGSTTCTVC